jgi:phosphatidylserine/phosphatidylglycerophosphate/cardiolipin synthase-like enzyme
MSSSSFDFQDWLKFQPAKARCEKCLALLKTMPRNEKRQIYCPVCGVHYGVNGNFQIEQFQSYFRNRGLYIDINDPIEQGKQLAFIASRVHLYIPGYSPRKGLLQALNQAKSFVDFTSWGIDKYFLGVLETVAQRVKVRGLVSLPPNQDWLLPELERYKDEAENLKIKAVCTSSHRWDELPHQKLVVIDGLMAFKGSANLTQTAWRKAEIGYDEIEVVTDVEKVINLHNRYFSPVWADLGEYGDTIMIGDSMLDGSAA